MSTLPPYLLVSTIEVNPPLPADLLGVAALTHTWMGESIKIGLTYETPFWRANDSSGTIVSNVGPIPEMYDHADFEETHFALIGFLNGAYFSVDKTDRLELILKQLEHYYGAQARNYVKYEEVVWRNEPFTHQNYNQHILPHQNNGHPIYRQTYLNDKLLIAGSETGSSSPGYMGRGGEQCTRRFSEDWTDFGQSSLIKAAYRQNINSVPSLTARLS